MTTTTDVARQDFPHSRWRLPIIGDLLTVNMTKPCQGMLRDMETYGGLLEQKIVNFPVIVVSRVDLVEEINNEEHWEKHVGPTLYKLRSVAGDGMFTAYTDEPNWSKAHNILVPAFTKAAMESYHTPMMGIVGEFTDGLTASSGEWVDVAAAANRLTTEIIARIGVGTSFTALDRPQDTDPFIEAVLRELTWANRRTDALPLYEKLFCADRRRQHERDKAWLRERTQELIEARRSGGPRPNTPDMLDRMLDTADPETGEKLDDANIINQVLTLLVAGSETSANTIGFALHFLATHPEIAAAARAELDERWPGFEVPDIAFDDVARLRYLRRVVDESLRLWPVAPGYFRKARHETSIDSGRYRFQPGDWVFVLLLAAHRDTATWGPDAAEFRPDRFLPENLRQLDRYIYKPFGTGVRACVGRQFALHEIMLTLAVILHQFDIEPEPGYEIRASEALTLKPEGLRLRLTPRDR